MRSGLFEILKIDDAKLFSISEDEDEDSVITQLGTVGWFIGCYETRLWDYKKQIKYRQF